MNTQKQALPAQPTMHPTRWCCEGCKRSGESEKGRLESLLRRAEEERYEIRLRTGVSSERRNEIIADMQKRYGHLAGVRRSTTYWGRAV